VANYFFNDRRTKNDATAVIGTLAAGDTITLGADAVWAAINGSALQVNGAGRAYVHGQLYGRNGIEVKATAARVTIGSTGLVSGSEFGINATAGQSLALVNDGHIYGATAANLGASGQVINNGTISGDGYGVVISLVYTISVINTGTISAAAFFALQMTGNQPFDVVNSGTISAPGSAVYITGVTGFGGSLTNTGTLNGDITLSSARTATLENRGAIRGSVQFGSGDDLFDSSNGQHIGGGVSGGSGDDTLLGSADGNALAGGSGDDILEGRDGNDRLTGGSGADLLDGGDGIDLAAYLDSPAGVTVSLANPGLNTGDATGDTFIAIEGLSGSSYADTLIGDTRANRLLGQSGDDLLDGGAGGDTMRGGLGNDTYVVDSARDRVIERTGEGRDTVRASIDYVLPDSVEDLVLTGTGNADATGNELANVLTGNAGANIFVGGRGPDTLTGGAGADVFVIDLLPQIDEVDMVTDFASREDRIRMSRSVFTGLNGGAELAPGRFAPGSVAGDANDRILYDRPNGTLYYDADGTGAIAPEIILQLAPGTVLVAADFQLVA
jgi:hypothetical protein